MIWQLQILCKYYVFSNVIVDSTVLILVYCRNLLIQQITSRGHLNYLFFYVIETSAGCVHEKCIYITHLLTCILLQLFLVIYYFPKLTRAIDWSYGFALCFLKRPVETQVTYVKSPKPYICGAWTPSLPYWKTNRNVASLWPHQWLDAHGHIH